MLSKFLFFNFLILTVALGFFFAKPNTVDAACGGSGCCCESSRLTGCPVGCTQTSCGCSRECVVAIQCGWACQAIGSICGVPCQGEGWVTSSSCTGTPGGGGGNPPAPTPQPPSGGCSSGDCFTGISNCGEVGRTGGSGSCSGGLCCLAPGGAGGDPPAPFNCQFGSMSARNSTGAVDNGPYDVGEEIYFCYRAANVNGLITQMRAQSNNSTIINYSGVRNADTGQYLAAETVYCPGPRGSTVGPGETNFLLRVYGKRCPACATELMCQGNTSIRVTVNGAPTSPPTVDLRANGSASAITIVSGSRFTLSWSSTNVTSCAASGGWSGTQGTSGSIQSSALTTTTTYNINCSGPGGNVSDSVTVNVSAPPTPPTVNLLVNGGNGPITIARGGSATLSWSTTNATSCTASGGWSGGKAVPSGSQSTGAVNANTIYSITCTGTSGTATDSVSVAVSATPPTVDLRVNNSNGPVTVASGGSVSLSWSTSNATSCTASGGWSGSKATAGSQTISGITSLQNYTLNCTGSGGNASDSVSVTVSVSPPTVNLTVNGSGGPITVASGSSINLAWSATNASSCSASGGWSGGKAIPSGSQTISNVTTSQNYILGCSGPNGNASDTVTVQVAAAPTPPPVPAVDLRVNGGNGPISINSGGSISLSWTTSNITTCSASGGWNGGKAVPSGSQTISNITTNTTYVLNCSGPGGNTSDSVSVGVSAAPTATVDLRVNGSNGPVTITSGTRVTVSWSSTNATTCVASGGWSGNQATSGSIQSNPLTSNTTYTLSCSGPGGSSSDTVSVNVGSSAQCSTPAPRDPPATSCAANSSSNGTITWEWAAVAGATEYDVDIYNAATSAIVTNNGFQPAANFNCGSGTCRYTTSHMPGTPYRSSIVARGTCTASSTGVSSPVAVPLCAVSNPPTVDIRANGANSLTVPSGTNTTLSWSSTNATSCTASGAWSGSRATSGSQASGAITSTRTYTITCTGTGGNATDSVTITLGAPPPVAPTVDLRANGSNGPLNVPSGSNINMSWSSTNATSCSASATVATSGWSGSKPVSGSQTLPNIASTRTFAISCTGTGGTVNDSVVVNVAAATPAVCTQPAPRDPPAVTCAPSGSNGTVVWAWNSVTGANQYEVDIINVGTGAVVIDNGFLGAGVYGCAGGPPATCSYTTNLPTGTYRSRIRARGTCTDSPVALSQPTVVPACMSCSVNLLPDPVTVESGQTNTLTAQATVTNGTATSVAFSSGNSSIASVTTPDNSAPFTSTITGGNVGATTITATLSATNTLGETCSATDQITANVEPPGPWWQAVGADVTAMGSLQSLIPATCGAPCAPFLIRNPVQGSPGVAVYGPGGNYDFSSGAGQGNASQPNWLAQTAVNVGNYSYASFNSLVPNQAFLTPSANLDSGTASSDGYVWYKNTGDMTINTPQAISKRIVLFVDGNLQINQPINLTNRGSSFLMVIVRGDIIVSDTLTSTGGNPAISGIFVTDGRLRTGAGSEILIFRGSIVARQGFVLERDLEEGNVNLPAEVFEYAPELSLLIPRSLTRQVVIWREIVP